MDVRRARATRASFLERSRAAAARGRGAPQPASSGSPARSSTTPDRYAEKRFWVVDDGGEPVAAAMQTPPYNLILARPRDDAALAALAAGDRRTSCRASSARSPRSTRSSRLWSEAHEVEPRIAPRAGRLRARAGAAGPAAPGRSPARRPRRTQALLLDWMVAFGDEVLEEDDPGRTEARHAVDHRLARRRRRLPALGGRRRAGLARRLGRADAERDPDRPGLHAARPPRPRLRDRARRRALADAARRRPALLLPLHRPREPDVERDLRADRLRRGSRESAMVGLRA